MAPPRPINGTIGSRIRVIFGDTGNEWLLLLDNDDGNLKWQSKLWKSIPKGLAKRINKCERKGRQIQYVDIGPNNSWYAYGEKEDGSGGHCWWGGLDTEQRASIDEETSEPDFNMVALGSQDSCPSLCVITGGNGYHCINIPTQLEDRIRRNNRKGRTVQMIRLFSNGRYYIEDDQGSQWGSLNNHLDKEIKKRGKVEEVAVAGDGSWIVVRGDSFVSSVDVDTELEDIINTFFSQQRERNRRRQREIDEYHDIERAPRVAVVAAGLWQILEVGFQRAAREAEERRAEEERKRREEEERARKSAKELVEKLTLEKENIDKLETNLEAMQDDLYSRKRSLRESIGALPPAQRPRWDLGEEKPSKRQEKPQCVICQDKAPVRAVVPCGHVCLCDDCAPSISQRPFYDRLCPLCRGPAPCTLRIYA